MKGGCVLDANRGARVTALVGTLLFCPLSCRDCLILFEGLFLECL